LLALGYGPTLGRRAGRFGSRHGHGRWGRPFTASPGHGRAAVAIEHALRCLGEFVHALSVSTLFAGLLFLALLLELCQAADGGDDAKNN
jgi:hypothetical protein